jgi:hypothetical protein
MNIIFLLFFICAALEFIDNAKQRDSETSRPVIVPIIIVSESSL